MARGENGLARFRKLVVVLDVVPARAIAEADRHDIGFLVDEHLGGGIGLLLDGGHVAVKSISGGDGERREERNE